MIGELGFIVGLRLVKLLGVLEHALERGVGGGEGVGEGEDGLWVE